MTTPAPLPSTVAAGPAARSRSRVPLHVWHRLLTPGGRRPSSADRLRGWARLLDWLEAEGPGARRRLLVRILRTPLDAWRRAGNAVARFGAEVQAVSGLSPEAQRRQLWWLAVRHGLDGTSYLDYQLYRPERRRRAGAFVQEREYYRLVRWLNAAQRGHGDGYLIHDKRRFFDWCRAHGFPAVPTLLEYEQGELVASTLAGDPATSLPPGDLFSKPSDATGGHGTARWRYDGAGGWVGADGRTRTAPALLAELAHVSSTLERKYGKTSRRILLQPCLRNHRDLLPLTPGGLCTVRILTYRAPGERARALLAAYKMPTGDAPADNFHFGGLVAPVDMATGRLGTAIRRQGHVIVPVERHPDTGVTLAGRAIPHWREAVDLAERALDAARLVPSIGWDVAITDDGPVLIEGNTGSNPDIAQAPTGTPLADTPFPDAFDRYMRAHLAV